ncbi:lactonase family protein [Clostridium vincentii]|uniref:6-phosphogluconolactonase n=1 Tax=Clostridium vincentii TaxID=52704 RepID=A0A2T0BJ85_9CLOT|nr:lactonase family protein [Clostridium vincentii]PRR83862.1 6-phosphogluconolactonase [Clostridium vincentii]
MSKSRGYFGAYTKKDSKGIYSFNFDEGKFSDIGLVAEIENPTYLNVRGKEVFSITKENEIAGISYFIDENDKLILVNAVINNKFPCCYITSNKEYIFASNYHEGKCYIYKVSNKELHSVHTIHEKSYAKCHCVILDNKDRYIYVCFLGLDRVKVYDLNNNFAYVDELIFPEGSGPRHGLFSKDNNNFYVLSELSNEVFVFKKYNEKYVLEQTISTLPNDFEGESSSAAIRLSSDEKFLYTSNRGHDSIAAFKINKGILEIIDYYNVKGQAPRDFNFDPSEEFLLVVNQDTSNGVSFKRNKNNGMLEEITDEISIDSSVCILFRNNNLK